MLCRLCAENAFRDWKGWPDKKRYPLPEVPEMVQDQCPECGGRVSLREECVVFLNVHSLGSSGLPDYFVLRIYEPGTPSHEGSLERWGYPYLPPSILGRYGKSSRLHEWWKSRSKKASTARARTDTNEGSSDMPE